MGISPKPIPCCLRRESAVVAAAAGLLAGCNHGNNQSTLHPAGPAAAAIAWLWWIMLAAFAAVFVLVVVLLLRAIFRPPTRSAPPLGRSGFIVAGGVLLPVVVLTPLYLVSLRTSVALQPPVAAHTVRVVGHMWWWEVRYPEHGIVTANELHIPIGEPVRLELASVDVIHSFWTPRLHGKRDLIPGIENEFWIQADEPGVFRGLCGEYCGTQHARMGFLVVALPRPEFDAWVEAHRLPRPPPAAPEVQRGAQVFTSAGCGQCHAVRGTPAIGNVGPDLTHIASRRTLGAAALPNTPSNLARWIADPQAIKPGIKMPPTQLPADDLRALVSYLESLP